MDGNNSVNVLCSDAILPIGGKWTIMQREMVLKHDAAVLVITIFLRDGVEISLLLVYPSF